MRFQRGFTYTDKALLLADRILFQTSTGMRLSVPKVSGLKFLAGEKKNSNRGSWRSLIVKGE